jgi:hypothetical protein
MKISRNIVCVLKPVVKRMIVVMSCLVELCGEEPFPQSPERTSSPDGIEQVRKRVDMIERAIGIGFIKQFKQPPITDDTLTDCESNEDTPIEGIIDGVKTNGDDIVDSN